MAPSKDEEANGIGNHDDEEVISEPPEDFPEEASAPSPQQIPILPIHIALLRFATVLAVGWIMAYASMSANAKWTVETYVPWSFWLLHYLLIFGVIGGGWPLAAPHGMAWVRPYWNSMWARLLIGVVMTGLVVGMGALLSALFTNAWVKYPIFPGSAWFGIGLFWMTLWWVLDIQTSKSPLIPMHSFPPVNMLVSSLICILLAVAVFQFVNYPQPFTSHDSNPEGPSDAPWWFGWCVSVIVWVHNFASILVFQNWPFTLLPNPYLQHAALTATTILLGWAVYEIVIACGVDKGFYADAVGASQISWSLFHTVGFDFWPFHRMTQPKRGLYSFVFSQCVIPFFWIWLCRIMLEPIYNLMVKANPLYGVLFTLNTMIPWYSLHVVAPLLLFHHAFFMRWPLPPGGPPLGPMDKGMVQNFDDEDDEQEDESTMKEQGVELLGGDDE